MEDSTSIFNNFMYQVRIKWHVTLFMMFMGAVLEDVAVIARNVRRMLALKLQMQTSELHEYTIIDTAQMRALLSDRKYLVLLRRS